MDTEFDSVESKVKAILGDEECEDTTGLDFNDLNMAKQKELLIALESLSLDVLGRDYQEKMHNLQRTMVVFECTPCRPRLCTSEAMYIIISDIVRSCTVGTTTHCRIILHTLSLWLSYYGQSLWSTERVKMRRMNRRLLR